MTDGGWEMEKWKMEIMRAYCCICVVSECEIPIYTTSKPNRERHA